MYVPRHSTACTTVPRTLLGWAGQIAGPLGTAVGVAYIRPKSLWNETAEAGHYKHMATRSLPHYTHLPLGELRITHSQTHLHTSGVAGALDCTVRRPQRRLCDSHISLCIHSHPAIKERKGKDVRLLSCVVTCRMSRNDQAEMLDALMEGATYQEMKRLAEDRPRWREPSNLLNTLNEWVQTELLISSWLTKCCIICAT